MSRVGIILLILTVSLQCEMQDRRDPPWWSNTFLISTFSAVRHGDEIPKIVAALHELGFNALESNTPLEYRAQDLSRTEHVAVLKACKRYGMRYFVTDHERLTGVAEPTEEGVLGVIEDFGGYPGLGGYYIWDEPRLEDFPSVQRAAEIVRAHDASRLPMVAMLPSYGPYRWPEAYPAFASQFMRLVDPEVVAFDFYGVRQNTPHSPPSVNAFLYRDLQLWSDLARAYDRQLWFYGSAVGWGPMAAPSLATLRFQAAAALTYGARGLIWFMARDYIGGAVDFTGGALDAQGEPGPIYADLARVNYWMRDLAPTLLSLVVRRVVLTDPVPAQAQGFSRGFAGLTLASGNLLLGEHVPDVNGAGARDRYLWVVNRDLEHQKLGELSFRCAVTVAEVAADAIPEASTSQHQLQLDAGEGKLLRISPEPGCDLNVPLGNEIT